MPIDTAYPIKGRLQIEAFIGSGSASKVFRAQDLETGLRYAVKTAWKGCSHLNREMQIYHYLSTACPKEAKGIPYGKMLTYHGGYDCLVIQLLGHSLQDFFDAALGGFSRADIFRCGLQMLDRIAFIHNMGLVHRDIKPSNILVGSGRRASTLYLIDYGVTNYFRHPKTKRHVPLRRVKGTTDIPLFASKHAHDKLPLTRRDDLISLGYVLLYLIRHRLPWQGVRSAAAQAQIAKRMSAEDLCIGAPKEMQKYFENVYKLGFSERPDYGLLRSLFLSGLSRIHAHPDGAFDWMKQMKEGS